MSEGIKETLERIESRLDEQSNSKRDFKLPIRAKLNKTKLKKGYATIAYITENGSVEFMKQPIIDNTVKVNDTIHSVSSRDVLNYKGKPFVFLVQWNEQAVKPFSMSENFSEAEKEKTLTYGQKYVAARMMSDQIKSKTKISAGLIIGIIILMAVGYAIFSGGLG